MASLRRGKLGSGSTTTASSDFSGHQRSAQLSESGRSPSSSSRHTSGTAQQPHPRRAYESYQPERAYETDTPRASLRSPTSPQQAPPNAPKGPGQRFRNISWVVPKPPERTIDKPPRVVEAETSTQSAPRWGGEEFIPTPASVKLSAHSSADQRDQTLFVPRQDQDEEVDVAADAMDVDVERPSRTTNNPPTVDTQSTPVAPAAPMGGIKIRSKSSTSNPPETPFQDDGTTPAPQTTVHNYCDTSLVSAELWDEWKKLTDDKDTYLVGLVLSQQAYDAHAKKLQRLKADTARFATLAFDPQHNSKLATEMKEQVAEVEKSKENTNEYVMKRYQISEKLATLQKKLFAGVIHQSSQTEARSSTSRGPSQAEFDELRKELADAKASSRFANTGPSHTQFDDLKSELAEMKTQLSRQQKDGIQARFDALKKDMDELKRSPPSIPQTTIPSATQAKLTAIVFRVEKLEATLNARELSSPSPHASKQELTSQISKLTDTIKKAEQDARDAKTDARVAKEKAQTVHANLSDKVSKVENNLEELSAQLEDSAQPKGPATEISPALRESLREEFDQGEAVKTLQSSVRGLDQSAQDFRHQLGEVKVALGSHSRALASIDQVSNDLKQTKTQVEEHGGQLAAFRVDLEQVKLAKAQPSPTTQPTPPTQPDDPQTSMNQTRSAPLGPVQEQVSQLPGVNQQTQALMSRLLELEGAIAHITRRLDQTSMSPQAKAILGVMLQQIPSGPQIRDEIEQSRKQRQEVASHLITHRQALVPLEQMQQALLSRMDAIEETTNREQTSTTSDIWAAVDDLRSKVTEFQDAIGTAPLSDVDFNKRLNQLDKKVAVFDRWYRKAAPEMGLRLIELKDLLGESNIRKLQQLPDEVPHESQTTSASPVPQHPGQQQFSKAESVKMTAFQKHSRPKSSDNSGMPRTARAGQTRTLSERESSAEDSDGVTPIPIRKTSKTQPDRVSSQTPSLPSRPASTHDTEPAPGMTKKLFKRPRTRE